MRCSQCGAEIRREDRFCGRCGAPRPQLLPAFVQAQARMEQLQALSAAGQVDAATFEAGRRALTVEGPQGGYWSPGGGDTWYWYDGSAWVQREPPLVQASGPAATPPPVGAPVQRSATPVASQQPAGSTARRKRRPWLWVVIAAVVLLTAAVVVALSLWVGPAWLRPERAVPTPATVAAQVTQAPARAGATVVATSTAAPAAEPATPSATPTPPGAPAGELGFDRAAPLPRTARVEVPGWDVQVLEVLRGDAAWRRILEDKPDAEPPPPGEEYLALHVRARCRIVDAYSHSFGLYDLYVTGSGLVVHTDRLQHVPAPELVYMDLYTAEQLEGWVDVLVGQDEHDLMFVVAQIPWGEDPGKYVRYVALEEGASLTVPDEILNVISNDLGSALAQPAPLGETVVSEAWETTIVQALRGEEAWTFVQQLSSGNDPPEEGMEYVLVEARVRRIGADDGARFVSLGDFYAVASDGATYETPRIRSTDAPVTWMQAGLYPGGEHQGWVVLQVPVADDRVIMRFMPREAGGGTDSANVRYLAIGE